MTHRSDLAWIDISDDLARVREKIQMNPHAVYPVSDYTPDKLLGLVTVNDIFQNSSDAARFNLENLVKKPVYVHGSSKSLKSTGCIW